MSGKGVEDGVVLVMVSVLGYCAVGVKGVGVMGMGVGVGWLGGFLSTS